MGTIQLSTYSVNQQIHISKSRFTVYYSPDLPPSDYHLFPGLEEKQLKCRHLSSDAEVIAAAETWLDGQHSEFFFLSGLQMLEQQAKKYIELRVEYVEQIPSLVAVACLLPGRAKDLSAPPRNWPHAFGAALRPIFTVLYKNTYKKATETFR